MACAIDHGWSSRPDVIVKTLEIVPPDGGTHWSTRQMAAVSGLNQTAVSRIWRAFSLQPRRVEHFKLSKDPLFVEKVRDIVGLYLDPPERAVVLCVEEKSQIQALDRSAPILPLLPSTPARMSHDYKRNGTSSLFAALNVSTGMMIRSLHARHRAIEFKQFLIKIDKEVPADPEVHASDPVDVATGVATVPQLGWTAPVPSPGTRDSSATFRSC